MCFKYHTVLFYTDSVYDKGEPQTVDRIQKV